MNPIKYRVHIYFYHLNLEYVTPITNPTHPPSIPAAMIGLAIAHATNPHKMLSAQLLRLPHMSFLPY